MSAITPEHLKYADYQHPGIYLTLKIWYSTSWDLESVIRYATNKDLLAVHPQHNGVTTRYHNYYTCWLINSRPIVLYIETYIADIFVYLLTIWEGRQSCWVNVSRFVP